MLTFCRHLNDYVPEKVIFYECKVLFKWDSKIGCLQPVLQEVSVSFISFYLWVHSEATFLSRIPPNGNINGIQMAISFRIFYFQNSGKFLWCSVDSSPLLPPLNPTSFPIPLSHHALWHLPSCFECLALGWDMSTVPDLCVGLALIISFILHISPL